MGGRKNFLKKIKSEKKIDLDGVFIHNLKTIEKIPSDVIRFKSEIEMEVETEKQITQSQLKSLHKLEKQTISVYENSGKKNQKKIYHIKYKKISDKSFSILMKADGGVPLKRFVNGSEVEPSLTSVLENQCKCKVFDFHEISLLN